MRWLIVLDGTERSDRAAAFAAPLIRSGEDEVLLLAAGENLEESDLKAALDRNRPLFNDVTCHEQIIADGIAETVSEVAEARQINVVVYGSRGRRGWSRLLLGSVASYLERHLGCSLLVVRGELKPMKKILIASSLYPQLMQPVILATRLAQRTGATVTLLHVMSQLALIDEASVAPLEATAEEAIELHTREGDALAERIAYMEAQGVQAKSVLRHGLVIDELVAEMQAGRYDLLVIGAHREQEDIPFWNLLAEACVFLGDMES